MITKMIMVMIIMIVEIVLMILHMMIEMMKHGVLSKSNGAANHCQQNR